MDGGSIIVIDTNVLAAAMRSRNGASFVLLKAIGTGLFRHAVSTAVALEYEDVLLRQAEALGYTEADVARVIDYVIGSAILVPIHYRWRPFLRDPSDECLLELAVAAGAEAIVTYNKKDFRDVESTFGIRIETALEFLQEKGVMP
jgi:putative PIN family toxin of toxin-antitoxin system